MSHNKKHIYKPSLKYINSVHSNKQLIYQDKSFTFTIDDLYFSNSNGINYIYLDVSKYFNIDYNKFKSKIKYKSPINVRMKKKKLLNICNIRHPLTLDITKLNNIDIDTIPFENMDITSTSLDIIPVDRISDSKILPNCFCAFTCRKKDVYTKIKLSNVKKTDRHLRSNHQNMSIMKKFKKLKRQLKINKKNEAWDNLYTTYKNFKTKKNATKPKKYVYKKAKPFGTMHSVNIYSNVINIIAKALYKILLTKINNPNQLIESANKIMCYDKTNREHKYEHEMRRKYKIIRLLYVLLSIGKYGEAVNMILIAATASYYPYKLYNKDIQTIHVKIDINKNTMDRYNKKFDLFYNYITKYTYNDMYKIDKYMSDNIPKNYNTVLKNKTNNSCKSNILNMQRRNNFYKKSQHGISIAHNYKCLSMNMYIMPEIIHAVNNSFNNFSKFTDITNWEHDEFIYGFVCNLHGFKDVINGLIKFRCKKVNDNEHEYEHEHTT